MIIQRCILLVLFLLNWTAFVVAQNKMPIDYVPPLPVELNSVFPSELDSSEVEFTMFSIKNQANQLGYYGASVDSFSFQYGRLKAYFFLGEKLRIRSVLVDSFVDFQRDDYLEQSKVLENSTYQWSQSQRILNDLSNSGYPLAFFTKKRILLDSSQLQFEWNLSKGPKIVFGDIILKDSTVINRSYLLQLLKIRPGKMFEISKVEAISKIIANLDFVTLKAAPKVVLVGQQAEIHVDLVPRNSSVFNFLLGVLPSNVGGTQKFTISGELKGHFKNKLKYGEELYVHFNQLKKERQRIEFAVKYPFLFRSPIGISSRFQLFRNEKSTIDQLFRVGASYSNASSSESTFYTQYTSSRLLNIDTASIIQSGRLPSNLDLTHVTIGVTWNMNQLDMPLNPRRGWSVDLDLAGGRRSIIRNQKIIQISSKDTDFSKSYDSLNTNALKVNIRGSIQKFIPIKSRSTILLQNQFFMAWSPSSIYLNEYYRAGGINSVRGFDDESLVAAFLSFITMEYRYLLGENAYMSVFADYGYMYNPILISEKWNSLLGLGMGLSFQVPTGVFSIEFALGKQHNNPIDFRNTKSHFGFVTLF